MKKRNLISILLYVLILALVFSFLIRVLQPHLCFVYDSACFSITSDFFSLIQSIECFRISTLLYLKPFPPILNLSKSPGQCRSDRLSAPEAALPQLELR